MLSRVLLIACLAAVGCAFTSWDQLDESYTFEQYYVEAGRTYARDSAEYAVRKAIFEEKLAHILAHNRNPANTWQEGVNQFTDRTIEEFKEYLGYRLDMKLAQTEKIGAQHRPSMSAEEAAQVLAALPASVDWRQKGAVTPVKNQGACGSCWTFAASETLESAWFLKTNKLVVLSEQQFCSCTENPQHCGGTGGCSGGTAEVAYATAIKFGGVASEAEYPYKSGGGQDYPCKFSNATTPPVAHLSNYIVLPENEQVPLLEAVANVGPIAISVDASAWSMYAGGVFSGCSKTEIDINHAVQLVGYGTDAAKGGDYYLVRNSWGASWGENGYIRVFRGDPNAIECGPDNHPQDGTGCDNGPTQVTACGTCGILYDSCYPVVQV